MVQQKRQGSFLLRLRGIRKVVPQTTVVATILVVFVLIRQAWQLITLSVQESSAEPNGGLVSTKVNIIRTDPFPFCQSTRRCQPIPADRDRISYLHISKNAGSSWIQEFKRIKNISTAFVGGSESFSTVGLYPTKHGDYEHSYAYQERLLQPYASAKSSYQRFVTLRSPRHHVWSLFSQCYFSQWGILETFQTKFPRSHPNNVMMDFQLWLDHFVNSDTKTIRQQPDAYHCYHPANYQSRALSSVIVAENPHTVVDNVYEPDKASVNSTYWNMDWVSLTSFFHESKCILYHRINKASGNKKNKKSPLIQEYLEQTCHCRNSEANDNGGHSLKDVKDTHYKLSSNRPVVKDFPLEILQKIDILTNVDRFIYKMALQQFVEELIWVESELHQRILCDEVLDQWDNELNYLDFPLKSTYFTLRRARKLDRKVS